MTDQAICANLEIVTVPTLHPVDKTMRLQYELQARLNKLPAPDVTIEDTVTALIYWRHCIHSECDELLAWFKCPDLNFTELEMEAVDILHFVYNIGIALNIQPAAVQFLISPYTSKHTEANATSLVACQMLICDLSAKLTNLIDLFPWKSWKNYSGFQKAPSTVLKAYVELVEANLILAANLGMSMQRIVDVYIAKNKENHARQDRGY